MCCVTNAAAEAIYQEPFSWLYDPTVACRFTPGLLESKLSSAISSLIILNSEIRRSLFFSLIQKHFDLSAFKMLFFFFLTLDNFLALKLFPWQSRWTTQLQCGELGVVGWRLMGNFFASPLCPNACSWPSGRGLWRSPWLLKIRNTQVVDLASALVGLVFFCTSS